MPGDVANDAALLSALVANAADASGFRIVGSRVTFAWFSRCHKPAPCGNGTSQTGAVHDKNHINGLALFRVDCRVVCPRSPC